MEPYGGIDKKARGQLVEIVRRSKSTITVEEAAGIINLPRRQTAKLMARWASQGWLVRLRRGLYAPVPLGARTADSVVEDPWVIAERLFAPCYVSGFSAAEHWGLTEQIFRTVIVLTIRTVANRKPKIQSTEFWVKRIAKSRFFGTEAVWRERVKIQVADQPKTIVDMLDEPLIGGGARMVENILRAYLASPEKNVDRLLNYAKRMKNGAILKRLGFLLERSGISDRDLLSKISEGLTTGNAKLDPTLPAERLVTRWRLWVPSNWKDTERDRPARAA